MSIPLKFSFVRGWSLSLAVVIAMSALNGCESPSTILEPIIYANRGGMSPQTEFAFFRASVDPDIKRELAGEKPRGEPTWKKYWQGRYDLLRVLIAQGNPEYQQYIFYIYQQRQLAHLPLYDNGKPPSKAVYGDY